MEEGGGEAGDWGSPGEEKGGKTRKRRRVIVPHQTEAMHGCLLSLGPGFCFCCCAGCFERDGVPVQAEELEGKIHLLEHARQTRANRTKKGDATSLWFVRLAYRGARCLCPTDETNISRVDMTHSARTNCAVVMMRHLQRRVPTSDDILRVRAAPARDRSARPASWATGAARSRPRRPAERSVAQRVISSGNMQSFRRGEGTQKKSGFQCSRVLVRSGLSRTACCTAKKKESVRPGTSLRR